MERVLKKQITCYLETSNLINANQHGFRHNHSCSTQLLSQLHYILSNSVKGLGIDSIYIDYAKAFDKVDHGLLLKKLKCYGIVGNYFNWIVNFLQDRRQTVFVNDSFSYETSVISGVPQGSVLATLLFILYNNDLTSAVDSNALILSFADDTKLLSTISSVEDQNALQLNLNSIIEWSKVNNMELNNDKFELLSFNLSTNNPNKILLQELPFQTYLNVYSASDFVIVPSTLVRDLGVYFDEKLNWAGHYNIILQKAKKMCAWIFSSMYSRDKEVLLVLFNALVRSNLEYCCEVWCPHLKKDILSFEQIQRSFTNRISGLQRLNYWERLHYLKISSLQRRREKLIILHV